MKESKHKPCPSCSSTDLVYNTHISYGHGDCSFDGWIECRECGLRDGFVGDWGQGSIDDQQKAWNKWDGKVRFKSAELTKEEKDEGNELWEKLVVKYGGEKSLIEFLTLLNP